MPNEQGRVSILASAAVAAGIILAFLGGIFALLGLAGTVDYIVKLGKFELTTTSSGLAVMTIGALLAGYVITHLPAGVGVFAGPGNDSSRRGRRLLAAGVIGGLLLVISVIVSN